MPLIIDEVTAQVSEATRSASSTTTAPAAPPSPEAETRGSREQLDRLATRQARTQAD